MEVDPTSAEVLKHTKQGSLKSFRLYSCCKAGSTASNPFLKDIYLSCFLKSPLMETPQSIKVIPSSASAIFPLSKLNHPCWDLSLLLATKNEEITLFSPLQLCETRSVFLWALLGRTTSLFIFQTPNWALCYSQDLAKATTERTTILQALQAVVLVKCSRTVLPFFLFLVCGLTANKICTSSALQVYRSAIPH